MQRRLPDIAGWYGVIAILCAYALLSFEVIEARNLWYQLLNLTGALGIIIETGSKKDYEPLVLNIAWLAIVAIAIVKSAVS